jgi:hypothetical protein
MEGPKERIIPARTILVCTGCKYLQKTPCVRGRDKVTNTYHCTHEVAPQKPEALMFGSNIGFNIEGEPTPPDFCPFKNK